MMPTHHIDIHAAYKTLRDRGNPPPSRMTVMESMY